MPTYVYRRPDGTHFEVFQKISDDALTTDPESGEPVKRVISGGAGLQFKGSGFYLTDYVKKSGSADSAEPSSDAKPSDAKPAAKEPAKKSPAKDTASPARSSGGKGSG